MQPLIITSKINPAVKENITQAGWDVVGSGGTALEAALAAVNVSEADPRDVTVGYGGDPNETGVLQLDAAVMFRDDAGAVAALEDIKTPSSVARLVMERTDHLFLVGEGAQAFALLHGFKRENLLTDEARRHWLAWTESWSGRSYYKPGRYAEPEGGGTIAVLALDANGEPAGVTSTVGHHFKIPGRVGDTPIIGAGLYVDSRIGAAGATGHGEESIKICASFLAVEFMRQGMSPAAACMEVCRRASDRHGGNPQFNLKIIALGLDGGYGACALRGTYDSRGKLVGLGMSIHDTDGHRVEPGDALLPPLTEEERANLPLR